MATTNEVIDSAASDQSSSFRAPEQGCYAPAITFFTPETDGLDLNSQAKYYRYLASTGLKGLVILGTNAEVRIRL